MTDSYSRGGITVSECDFSSRVTDNMEATKRNLTDLLPYLPHHELLKYHREGLRSGV